MTYGKPKNGMIRTMPYYKIPFFKLASKIQYKLWKGFVIKNEYFDVSMKIDWHIPWFGGQCTPDFSCCAHKKL